MYSGRLALQLNGKSYTQCCFCKKKAPVIPFLKVMFERACTVIKKVLIITLGAKSQSTRSNNLGFHMNLRASFCQSILRFGCKHQYCGIYTMKQTTRQLLLGSSQCANGLAGKQCFVQSLHQQEWCFLCCLCLDVINWAISEWGGVGWLASCWSWVEWNEERVGWWGSEWGLLRLSPCEPLVLESGSWVTGIVWEPSVRGTTAIESC
jgi:hypothetical protein